MLDYPMNSLKCFSYGVVDRVEVHVATFSNSLSALNATSSASFDTKPIWHCVSALNEVDPKAN